MEWLADDVSLEAMELFIDSDDFSACMLLDEVRNGFRRYESNPGVILETMKDDYTKMFIGPDKLPLYHWESVYLKGDAVLFRQSTLDVRRAYLEEGFLPQGYPRVADDHIALELDFLVGLGERMRECYNKGADRGACKALSASKRFLDNHVLKWIGAYARDASGLRGRYFLYPEIIQLLDIVLRSDRKVLDDMERAFRGRWGNVEETDRAL